MINKGYYKHGYNSCNTCGCNPCSCGKLASNDVYLLSTSTTTTIPGPIGPPGDTYTPEETDNVFTI